MKFIILIFIFLSCKTNTQPQSVIIEDTIPTSNSNYSKNISKVSDIPEPLGYKRIMYDNGTYPFFIQNLPVAKNEYVETFSKEVIHWSSEYIIDKKLLFYGQDLEQCADWAMRLWADYHHETNMLDNLFLYEYSGQKTYYKNSGMNYTTFLKKCFSYSNSFSIKKGANEIKKSELCPGDMLVQNENGGIGHVSVILDIAQDATGNCLYLIGFSYMPAQQMHINWALAPHGEDGWNSLEGFFLYLQKTLPFGTPVFRRF